MGQAWGNCIVNGAPTIGCINIVLKNLVNGALIFLGAVAVIMIIYAGYKLLTAGGDAKKLDDAKKTLRNVIIGLIIVLLSFMIVSFISYVTGVNCITSGLNASGGPGCK